MTAHALRVDQLEKRYGEVAAVDGVSLDVGHGEFLTLLGPSGSGKTTILMAVAGFVEPTRGTILVDGRAITPLPPEKRNFGMVFQGYALFPHLSVFDNVGFPLRVRGVGKAQAGERIRTALDLVQLGHLADRMPRQLSGGQQQRVALARALVFDPDILLLDEPLSALDKKLRADLQWELKALHERLGTTFIYVTHDQEEALSMSDRIAIMRDGRLAQEGTPDDLYERPRSRFVADFLGKSNFFEGTVSERQADRFAYRIGGHVFEQAGEAAPGETVLIALRPEKIDLTSERPSDRANVLRADVRSANYYGTSFQLKVVAEDIGEVTVSTAAFKRAFDPYPGREIWLAWDPDASVVLREH
ncbi:ABC transporter ATP-binding protein [Marinivivus vitaminiproducens]|uniref:ABC transporter ATP-binding protein n=1 Tax=Marinivivus vitaminiproducens TaxID=3035935 RepID=UPI0027AAD4A1|nr:ABC transporter ATP-binding protein [Geminicoccaceae bacterium SCSIO 64248]